MVVDTLILQMSFKDHVIQVDLKLKRSIFVNAKQKKSTSRNRVSLKAIKKTKFGLSQLLKRTSEKESQNKNEKTAKPEKRNG